MPVNYRFRSLPLAGALLLATSIPAIAQVREEIVRLEVSGETVVGTLTLPDAAEPAPTSRTR